MIFSRHPLFWIFSCYLAITIGYSVVNPLFEAPDEHHHYFTAEYIAQHGQLPVFNRPDTEEWLGQEAAQPPLYYLLGSLLIRPILPQDTAEKLWLNPFVQMGDASAPNNRNRFVHSSAESFPYRGYALAAHILRLLSVLFGLGTLICLWLTARLLWPDSAERAYLTTALIAFLPQFNFLHSYINNDVAVIFCASCALLQLVAIELKNERLFIRLFALGLTIGLAILAKTAGLLLLIYAALFLSWIAWRKKWGWKIWVQSGLTMGLTASAVAGWWLWRNWLLYRDLTAANQFVTEAGGNRGYSLWQVLGESQGIWRSFVAVFGWLNVVPPTLIYSFWGGLVILAIIGGVRRLNQRALILAGWPLLVYAGMVIFLLRTPAAQGRLLMPAVLPLALGLGYGLSQFKRVAPIFVIVACLTTILCVGWVIPSAYRLPDSIDSAEFPELSTKVEDNLYLAVDKLSTTKAKGGDEIEMTLLWQKTGMIDGKPRMVVELFGRDGETIGRLETYHGGGLYPADLWPENSTIRERVVVRLKKEIAAPTQARVNVRIVDGNSADMGFIKVVPDSWPSATPEVAMIGDGIGVDSAEFSPATAHAGEIITIKVRWHVLAPPQKFLTTLVHLGDPTQPPIAQGDRPPLNGEYPTTWWEKGEVIDDEYLLVLPATLPAGSYPITIGMYDESIVALPIFVDGVNVGNNWEIGRVIVK